MHTMDPSEEKNQSSSGGEGDNKISAEIPGTPVVKSKPLKFSHITKTAGTAIEEVTKSLPAHLRWGRFDTCLRDMVSSGVDFWHVPAKHFDQKSLKRMLEEYDLFVCVRDPYDRLISEYYCQWGGPGTKSEDPEKFNSYLISSMETVLERLRGHYDVYGHYAPQYLYVINAKGERVVPDENVLRFETLAVDFDRLMTRYGHSFRSTDIPVINVSKPQHKKFGIADLSKRAIRFAQMLYKRDFELFGYEADLSKRLSIGCITAVSDVVDQVHQVQVEMQLSTATLGEKEEDVVLSKLQNDSASIDDVAEQCNDAGKHRGDKLSENELEGQKRQRTHYLEDSTS